MKCDGEGQGALSEAEKTSLAGERGRALRSLRFGNLYRRRSDHERVLRWIVTELDSGEVQESEFLTFMLKLMLKSMINTYYEAYYQTLEATRDQLQEIFDFDVFLMARCPDLHNGLSAAYGLRRRLSPMRRFLKRKWLTM